MVREGLVYILRSKPGGLLPPRGDSAKHSFSQLLFSPFLDPSPF